MPVLGFQVGFRPLEDEAQVAPIVVSASLSRDNLAGDDFR